MRDLTLSSESIAQMRESGIGGARYLHRCPAIWLAMSWRRLSATRDVSQKNRLKCFYYEQANRYFYGGETGGRSESVRRNRSVWSNGPWGANVLAVAIPRHRVVRHDGAVSGSRGRVAQPRVGRTGGTNMNALAKKQSPTGSSSNMAERVGAIDWEQVSHDLDALGSGIVGRFLSPAECNTLSSLYDQD